ncbi:MAG: HD domain-containing phosphohydrolase [Bacillota bacterium]|nr:HD domain-containing phosphohydrolase [Bacillota bacterium]
MRCAGWFRHLWTIYSWGAVAAFGAATVWLRHDLTTSRVVMVLFLSLLAMIARQLPVMKWGLVASAEWVAYFAGALYLPPVAAGWVPFLTIFGLQAIVVLQRRNRLPGQVRTLLQEAAFAASRQGLGFMVAVGLLRDGWEVLAAGWSGGAWLVLVCWAGCAGATGVLEALAGALRYRVNPAREITRYLTETGPAWLLALPLGFVLYVLLYFYGTTTVAATLVVLLIMLLLYTLLVFADVQGAYWDTVHTLVRTMESRDQLSPGEGERGACLAAAMGRKLHLPEADVRAIYLGALLRDIGLVGLDERLAGHNGVLRAADYFRMWEHALIGGQILDRLPRMQGAALAIRHHHERWDGSGYPDGLVGTDIPLEARLVALADAYVAMTSDRPFRRAMPGPEAWEQISRGEGVQFDPRLVRLFRRVVGEEACWGRNAFRRHYMLLSGS